MARPPGRQARPLDPRDRRSPFGSLDNLPRPLSERERRGPGRRRLGAIILAAVLAAAAVAIILALTNSPGTPVGAAQGAGPTPEATPRRSATTVAGGPVTSPRPTSRPSATAAPRPAAVTSLTGYQSPLPHGRLTLPFGPSPWGSRLVDGEPFHDGIDLATFCGDRVVAAHDGTVLATGRHYDQYMGWVGDLKPYLDRMERKSLWSTLPIVVVIDDGNGYRSIYAHFSKSAVKKGQIVKAGQLIGYEGQTGRASGCHVHYGLFSPLETATFAMDPGVVGRMKVPQRQIARIDPLLLLPMHAPRTRHATAVQPLPLPTPDQRRR